MKSIFKKLLILLPVGAATLACVTACGAHKHTYSKTWSYDEEYHWHSATCEHTDEQADKAEHTFTLNQEKSTVTCTTDGVAVYECECGYTYRTYESAGHLIEYVGGKEATCTEDGETPREVCTRDGCGYVKESEVIPATGHTFSSAWVWDDDAHWHPSTCGHDEVEGYEAHVYGANGVCKCGRSFTEADPANFTYKKVGNSYTVTGLSVSAIEEAVTVLRIPTTYNNLSVTAIADFAFEDNVTITRVNIPSGVAVIGREAFFGCTNLATLQLGDGLTEIGYAAFSGCASLSEVKIPSSVNSIASYAFENCSKLKTAETPASLSSLGEQVFSGCTSLQEIKVPNGISKLGSNMFLNCTSLSSVTLPSGITNIGSQAFANCTSLTAVSIPSGVEFIGQNAFKNSGLISIELPDAVTYLGAYAFKDCAALTSAKIGSGVTYTMGDWFSGCGALQTLTIPFVGARMDTELAASTSLGYIFGTTAPDSADADKFEAVTVDGHTYYVPKSLTSVTVLGGTYSEWRNDVETIKTYTLSAYAFNGYTMVTEVTLAAGVSEDTNAFAGWNGTVKRLGSESEA